MQVLSLEFEDDDEMVLLDETVSLLNFGTAFPYKTGTTFLNFPVQLSGKHFV